MIGTENKIVTVMKDYVYDGFKYDVYIVNGKIMLIEDDALDLNKSNDMETFLCIAKDLYEDRLSPVPCYGVENAACILIPLGNGSITDTVLHKDDLPDDLKEQLRMVMEF